MAVSGTTIQANNKLIVFRKEMTREYIRQNLFSPYIGSEATAIIRVINDLKKGGEQINIPLIARLKNQPTATGTLVGNEENIDNYGDRAWIDWARNAVSICSGRHGPCSRIGARNSNAMKSAILSTRSRLHPPHRPALVLPAASV